MYIKGLVSIIVPCYNMSEFLSETLNSVLLQTYSKWECIIINDGSTDNTDSIAQEFCHADKRFKYIKQENQGVSSARNNGIKQAKGEYILPLDGDDIIDKTYIQKAVPFLSEHPDTKLVYCKADKFGEIKGEWQLDKYSYNNLIWKNCIFCSALFRHTDYDQTMGYNTNMKEGLEDWDFWLSLIKENDLVHQIDEILFHYRIRKQSRNCIEADCLCSILKQIYNNHIDIYQKYNCELLYYRNQFNQKKVIENKYDILLQHYTDMNNNFSFKLGKLITAPFRWIKGKRRTKHNYN